MSRAGRGAHEGEQLLEVDFFSRVKAKGWLTDAAAHWNLGSLAYFLMYINARLTMKQGAGGASVYGNLKDGASAMFEVERICAWLMDPIACATTWPVLLAIRAKNPMYNTGTPPTIA